MRTVQEQLGAVLSMVGQVEPLDVVLTDAAGSILAADIVVQENVPALDIAACDGYAVRTQDLVGASKSAPAMLPVAHTVTDVMADPLRLVEFQSIAVSTGTALPLGADAVLPLNLTDRGESRVNIYGSVAAGSNIWVAGSDVRAQEVALQAGTRLGARQIAFAAGLGYQRIRVHPAPRVVVLPIGDELVQPGSRRPGVFDANGPSLRTAIQDVGGVAIQVAPMVDDIGRLREAIEDQLVRADMLITTGGLSEGPNDTLRDVLSPMGTMRFDHIAMLPAKNQGYGRLLANSFDPDSTDTIPMYALPGHPAAAQISFEVFVRPVLRTMAGYSDLYRPSIAAKSVEAWASPVGIRQFVPAIVTGSPDEGYQFTPVGDPTRTEDITMGALSRANALAVVPEDQDRVTTGSQLFCLILGD